MKSHYDGEEAGAGFVPQFELLGSGELDYSKPLVKPERMYNVETGINYSHSRIRWSANAYLMYFADEIVPSGGLDQFGVARTGNADETLHVGIETEVKARVVAGLDINANLNISRNRFRKFIEYDEFTGESFDREGNSIAGFPDITSNMTLSYSKKGATILVSAQLVGEQYIDNSEATDQDGRELSDYRLEPYVLANATLNYHFSSGSALDGLVVAIDVNNIANSEVLTWGNVSFGAPQFFPYATRHAFFKMKYIIE